MRTYRRQSKELNELLHDSRNDRSVTRSLFYRVFILVAANGLLTVPLMSLQLYAFIAKGHVQAYVSWSDVHKNFHEVVTYTTEQGDAAASDNKAMILMNFFLSWAPVFNATIFLAVFGTSKGLFQFYADLFWGIACKFGVVRRPESSSATTDEMSAVVFTSVVTRTEGSVPLSHTDGYTA